MSATSERAMELLPQIQKYLFAALKAGTVGKKKADSVCKWQNQFGSVNSTFGSEDRAKKQRNKKYLESKRCGCGRDRDHFLF